MRRVYLDHAAATPLDPVVLEAMLPHLREHYGNASSVHAMGRRARFVIEESRERVAALLGAEPSEIIFTSGGTESNNTAIKGVLGGRTGAVVTSRAEHESVLRTVEALGTRGHHVTLISPGRTGAVEPSALSEHIVEPSALVSLMHGNNELGTLTEVNEIAHLCRSRGVPFHTDAVQTSGYGLIRVDQANVDLMSLSGHKFYGPKGVGVLYVRSGVEVDPVIVGGSQERRRRGGTENVAAVVGLATAFERALADADHRRNHASSLRDRLYRGLTETMGDRMVVNTPLGTAPVMPHVLNVAFPPVNSDPVDGEMLLLNLDIEGVMASAGSACTSGTLEPSHVLTAIGLNRHTAAAGVRFSVGKDTTEDDVDFAVEAVERVMQRMSGQLAQK